MNVTKSLQDMSARMSQRKQRLEEEQQRLTKKETNFTQNPDAFSEPSEIESNRQAPKPKRRHHRSANRSPFDDDSSLQFGYQEAKSSSSNTTASTSPRQVNKFVKKPAPIPVTTEKISVTRSPRDVLSPRTSARTNQNNRMPKEAPRVTTGLLSQSSLLARAAHRKELYDKGIELAPGTFDKNDDDDESSSDATSTSGNVLFGTNKKSFIKKTGTSNNQVPDLQHLDSETNTSDRDVKKKKSRKGRKSSSGDTEDDSSLDFIDDVSSGDGHKTPILTPRKGILKSPKDYPVKESEHSVQFSENLFTVQTDDERVPTPTKNSRNTTPRRVQIAEQIKHDYEDSISSENESISTAIDIAEENDYENASFDEPTSISPVENIFANMILNNEPILLPTPDKKSPRRTNQKKPTSTTSIFQQPLSDVSDDDSPVEQVSEEPSVVNYSEDFTSGPTDTSTPRTFLPAPVRQEKPVQTMKKISTGDQQVQVDLMSAPFQSSLNQVHSIYLINQTDLNEPRPSSLIRSVIEPHVLQSTLTTNPVILAVDDLIREQSSLLRSFIQLQRTYYESTVRSITPNHIYVTKDNTLQFIADQRQTRMAFQSNDDSIAH